MIQSAEHSGARNWFVTPPPPHANQAIVEDNVLPEGELDDPCVLDADSGALVVHAGPADGDLPGCVAEAELIHMRHSKKRPPRPARLNFTQAKFLFFSTRLGGDVKKWAFDLASRIGVVQNRLHLIFAYVHFLGECLVRETGMHAASADVVSRWRSGAKQMAPVEAAYMNKRQPAMDRNQTMQAIALWVAQKCSDAELVACVRDRNDYQAELTLSGIQKVLWNPRDLDEVDGSPKPDTYCEFSLDLTPAMGLLSFQATHLGPMKQMCGWLRLSFGSPRGE
ncbi:unnamed protein product [Prorocentrum cordatum]|uniref:Uncharacterized protein n=1 Tax=Prorocentrum cordatum TaxID=2364126 RepID=A0ABN9SKW6_9DINO|nr:unnamed protein product [Polarella glacialis]